jgi:hypothetical protein
MICGCVMEVEKSRVLVSLSVIFDAPVRAPTLLEAELEAL